MSETFYRRSLPSPAIAFGSKQGKILFCESLKDGYMEAFFGLSEQFRTQDEPTFCGLSTLTMVLNTLCVDPKRVWKGPWRWYSEVMLGSSQWVDKIKQHGITFDEFACLGRCHQLNMFAKRPNERHLFATEQTEHQLVEKHVQTDNTQKYFTVNEFRCDVIKSCISSHNSTVIVSYSRKGLNQTGDGHFSPIGGYHKEKDMVLIMDVARFKYPPHWITIEKLYNAMCRMDKSCNKTRGWIVASKSSNNIKMNIIDQDGIKINTIDNHETTHKGGDKYIFMPSAKLFVPNRKSIKVNIGFGALFLFLGALIICLFLMN